MTLTDTGPLVALLDTDDASHIACVEAANGLPTGPLLTTWPYFTEAMYLLGSVGGWRYQAELWQMRNAGALLFHDLTGAEIDRVRELMQTYRDVPMDLADASIVAAAESCGLRSVFSIDSHFRLFRLSDQSILEVVP